MNMIDAVKSVLSQYFGFSGRARRSEYWFWYLATILVAIAIAILEALLGISSEGSGPISLIFSLLIFFPTLAAAFRRLHDTGRSGWWIGGFYLGVIIFAMIIGAMAVGAVASGSGDTAVMASLGVFAIIGGLAIIIYAIALLIFLCQDSHPGPNKYGSNPKNQGNYDVFE